MEKNKFTVDLGNLTLNDDQCQSINAAIQKAVTGELAKVNLKKHIVLIPIKSLPINGNGHTSGIIARYIDDKQIKNIQEMK